jgi:hypothetical protein
LMLGFYHYSYAIIYSIGTSKMIMQIRGEKRCVSKFGRSENI